MKAKWAIIILVLMNILPGLLLPKIVVDNTPDMYLVQDSEANIYTNLLKKEFVDDEFMFLHFQDSSPISIALLEKLRKLTDSLEQNPHIKRTNSVFKAESISASDDGFTVSPIIELDTFKKMTFEHQSSHLKKNIVAKNLLFSDDLHSFSVIIEPTGMHDSFSRLLFEDGLLKIISDFQLRKNLKAIGGPLAIDVAEFRSMLHDLKILIPSSLIIGLGLILFFFPSWKILILSALALNAVSVTSLSSFVIVGTQFTLISSMISSLLMAMTVAYLLHVYNAIAKLMFLGLPLAEACLQGAQKIKKPAFFSAITTAVGFASLATSSIVPIRYFGLISAYGIVLIYIVTIYIIPWAMPYFSKLTLRSGKGSNNLINQFIKLYLMGIRHHRIILLLTLALSVAAIPFFWKIKVETNLLKFFKHDHEIVRSTETIQKNFVGMNTINILMWAKDRRELMTVENLNFVSDLQKYVLSLDTVNKTLSVSDFIKDMHWAFHQEKDSYRVIPPNNNAISQYLIIYGSDDLYDYTTRNFDMFRISLLLNAHGAKDSNRVISAIRTYVDLNFPKDMQIGFASYGALVSSQEHVLVNGQIMSLASGLVIIFILMIILWRSLNQAIICMLPNISPIITIFFLMAVFNIWLDMGTAMIASVAVGIAVDDTIHLFHGFLSKYRKGSSALWALCKTCHESGKAVVSTTLILMAQFSFLLISDFIPTRNFGLLTAVGLATALLFDLIFLPALLYYVSCSKLLKRILS